MVSYSVWLTKNVAFMFLSILCMDCSYRHTFKVPNKGI